MLQIQGLRHDRKDSLQICFSFFFFSWPCTWMRRVHIRYERVYLKLPGLKHKITVLIPTVQGWRIWKQTPYQGKSQHGQGAWYMAQGWATVHELGCLGFEWHLCHSLVVRLWASYLTFLNLSFLSDKVMTRSRPAIFKNSMRQSV